MLRSTDNSISCRCLFSDFEDLDADTVNGSDIMCVGDEDDSLGNEAKSGMGGSVASRPMSAQLSVSC